MSDLIATIHQDPDPSNQDKPWIVFHGNVRVGNYATYSAAKQKTDELNTKPTSLRETPEGSV